MKSPSINPSPSPAKNPRAADESASETVLDARRRLIAFGIYLATLLACTAPWTVRLFRLAWKYDLHSHIILIPFISGYLIYTLRDRLPRRFSSSWVGGGVFAAAAVLAFALGAGSASADATAPLATVALALVFATIAGGFACFGTVWMRVLWFPAFFLIFAVPLPGAVVETLETGLKYASAEASDLLFQISGLPYLRDGLVFRLPGITLEVAQECSGIRSSYVLFITSLLAGYLLLNRPLHRWLVAFFVIPLGIIRNGFRIVVIGWLCVEIGPHMVHHVIHKRGGPLFFALSLIPFFALVWWLRQRESAREKRELENAPPLPGSQAPTAS